MPIAHYLYGDALGRAEQWDASADRFTTAIEKAQNKQHALALNGRGVAHAAKAAALAASGDSDAARKHYGIARVDFTDAFTLTGQRLADAQANIGTLAIQQKDGTREHFEPTTKH